MFGCCVVGFVFAVGCLGYFAFALFGVLVGVGFVVYFGWFACYLVG